MKQMFKYGTLQYDYYIEFADRKTFGMVVRPDLRIIVKVPFGTTLVDIEMFMKRKWKWLDKQLREFGKYQKQYYERQYLPGESFQYLGRQYLLEVEQGNDIVKLARGKLKAYSSKASSNRQHTQQLVDSWYDTRREAVFKRQYVAALKLFNYERMPQLRVRIMARRWGSYTLDNKVSLNPRLIETPTEAIYYVCVHELCHVVNKKHDKAFYDELEKHMPEWRTIKERLEIRYG
jgi:predicted metal-dependent hydrolase